MKKEYSCNTCVTKEEYFKQFSDEIKFIYGVELTQELHDSLIKTFIGLFRKSSYRTVGYITYEGNEIPVIYNRRINGFSKCIGQFELESLEPCVKIFFKCKDRELASKYLAEYKKEIKTLEDKNFKSNGGLAQYVFDNCYFPSIHMDTFNFKMNNKKIPKKPLIFKLMLEVKYHIKGYYSNKL